jgi:hypothetical protein
MKQPQNNSNQTTKKVSIFKDKLWLLPLLSGLVMLVIGFGLGSVFSKARDGRIPNNQRGSFSQRNNRGNGLGGFNGAPGGRMMGNFGQVTAISETSITIKNPRTEKEQTFTINSETKVEDSGESSSASNIKTGDTVAIQTSNSDTNLATRINLNSAPPTP